MLADRIRPIAICVVRNGDRILVEHGFGSVKDEHFCRPLGGAIEFGERAIDAIRREFHEELGADLTNLRLVYVMENLFQYEGEHGHEIVFIFEACFQDPRLNEQEESTIEESNVRGRASWVSLVELKATDRSLYPEGLLDVLPNGAG
jgi:ADP-ribose pyrophosphatase YjhB (NUDIX family)